MLQHDPQRSGYTNQEVRPPYQFLWRWHAPPLASRTQPVVAGGILYIGSLDGKMYALDAMTGQIKWTLETAGPIRHSAAVVGGRVFFGSHDTNIYALDSASGGVIWAFNTGAGISTAPVVANGTVYIGSRDGSFYALDAITGQEQWPAYETGGPIETSAALTEDGTIVFFGSEDMHAYAVNATSGQLKWSTKLPGGQSLRDRWPVVISDTVIFGTQPLVNFTTLLNRVDDLLDSLGADPPWLVEKQAIIDFLTDNPHYRDFFVLDVNSGSDRFIAPVTYSFGTGDIADMPVVQRDTDEVFVRYRFTGGFLNEVGPAGVAGNRYTPAIGRMDLANNDITSVDAANPNDHHLQFRMISDEPSAFSLSGSMLFVDSWKRLEGIDVDTGELFKVANVMDDWTGCNAQCHGKTGPMPVYDDAFPYDPATAVQSEGRCWRPAVIADGVIYWVTTLEGDFTELQPSALAAIRT